MLRFVIAIIAGALSFGTAGGQTSQGINTILRQQQQWKNQQLPANSVQRNFGGTNYAAAAWMERNKPNRKAMSAITLPQSARQMPMKNMGDGNFADASYLPTISLHFQTSFMKWLAHYLPAGTSQ